MRARRAAGGGAIAALVVLGAIGCGSSDDASDEPVGSTAATEQEGSGPDVESGAPGGSDVGAVTGPRELRLQGSRTSDGNSFDTTVTLRITGACDGTDRCVVSRPDGSLGFGVDGWELTLEPVDGAYAAEETFDVPDLPCGEDLGDGRTMAIDVAVAIEPGDGGQVTATLTERWSATPQVDLPDGTICSGMSATEVTAST